MLSYIKSCAKSYSYIKSSVKSGIAVPFVSAELLRCADPGRNLLRKFFAFSKTLDPIPRSVPELYRFKKKRKNHFDFQTFLWEKINFH